jgi:chaperonin cofactor prefoldin
MTQNMNEVCHKQQRKLQESFKKLWQKVQSKHYQTNKVQWRLASLKT